MSKVASIEGIVRELVAAGYDEPESIVVLTEDAENALALPDDPRPLVVAGIYGGILQWSLCLPGVGEPIFDLLDFDREGEDDESRTEWLAYADKVMARIDDRRPEIDEHFFDVDGLREDVEEMRPDDEITREGRAMAEGGLI